MGFISLKKVKTKKKKKKKKTRLIFKCSLVSYQGHSFLGAVFTLFRGYSQCILGPVSRAVFFSSQLLKRMHNVNAIGGGKNGYWKQERVIDRKHQSGNKYHWPFDDLSTKLSRNTMTLFVSNWISQMLMSKQKKYSAAWIYQFIKSVRFETFHLTIRLIDKLILTACQLDKGYFMPRGLRIMLIIRFLFIYIFI